ncbi:LutC/YkgG family protein [Namhaeicola litoreus]|uniref:Lactate utilization protein C n=1 Tax=Namhaeicola litoreus TaxID=1052145 RepID=A0ABW3Y3X1_9FLAO
MSGIKIDRKMGKEEILSRVKKNKPVLHILPEIDLKIFSEELDLIETFKNNVKVVGGTCYTSISVNDIYAQVEKLFSNQKIKYSLLPDNQLYNTIDFKLKYNQKSLENLDVFILKSNLGVAENGALWLSNNDFNIRVLPFITKHLILVIDSKNIVATLHDAYQNLAGKDYNFGIFISGPSKTADIEQSLVIGAQGAMSLTVFLT